MTFEEYEEKHLHDLNHEARRLVRMGWNARGKYGADIDDGTSQAGRAEAGSGEGWVKCHLETAAIALEALEFYAAERFKGFGDDPEPYEHHLAQQAIIELQDIVPQPPVKGENDD